MSKGFASLSSARRRTIASKGGKTAHKKGTAHKYNSAKGKVAVAKAVEIRKRDAAKRAWVNLTNNWGFVDTWLVALNLSHDELIKYGGARSGFKERDELSARVGAQQRAWVGIT